MSNHVYVGLPNDNAPKKSRNYQGNSHNNIFGGPEAVPCSPTTPRKTLPKTNIQEILKQDATDNKAETNGNSQPQKENNEPQKENNQPQNENKTENVTAPVQTPNRVRMPPGGYSSGFW